MLHEDLLFNSSSLGKHTATIKNDTLYLKQMMDWMSSNKAENNVNLKLSAEDELSRFRHKMLSKELGCEQRRAASAVKGNQARRQRQTAASGGMQWQQ